MLLVTGCTSGLGKEISISLAKKGYHVIILGKDSNKLDELYDNINSIGGFATIVQLDLRDFEGIDRLGLEINKKFRKLDILVLNAAKLGTLTPLIYQNPNEFEDIIKINLFSNFRLIRSLDFNLKKSNDSCICFISSKLTVQKKSILGCLLCLKIWVRTVSPHMVFRKSKKKYKSFYFSS